MNFLIDTHVLIWFGETSQNLPNRIRLLIEDTSNQIFVSHASIWEMAIKMSIGKLQVTYSLADWEIFLADNDFQLMPTKFKHFQNLLNLPFHHQDPFDRLLIAQAMAENLTIVTHDPKFLNYPVKVEFF